VVHVITLDEFVAAWLFGSIISRIKPYKSMLEYAATAKLACTALMSVTSALQLTL